MSASTKWMPLVLCVTAVLLIGAAPARAQAGFFEKELGGDPAKVVEDVKLDMMPRGSHGSESGSGPSPYLKALGAPPKRVGLVSYDTVDIGNLEESSALTTAATSWYGMRSTRVTQEGISLINEALYHVGFPAMKEALAAHDYSRGQRSDHDGPPCLVRPARHRLGGEAGEPHPDGRAMLVTD